MNREIQKTIDLFLDTERQKAIQDAITFDTRKIDGMLAEIRKLEEQLEQVKCISEIYEGVPIRLFGSDIIRPSFSEQPERQARMHKNAHNNGRTWCVGLTKGEYGQYREYFNMMIPTKKQAMKIAKDWVALGKSPNQSSDV